MCDVGILTFHCADNFGAMLQAYGLKTYLRGKGIEAEIVPYEPPFMTGRHWWIPYAPIGSAHDIMKFGWNGWWNNLKLGKKFFVRRANMKRFRKQYLLTHRVKKVFFISQFKKLPYQYYIVGSDQIWNPDITCGLKPAYFGFFESKRKKKVIAYAASLGSDRLLGKYDREFAEFLQYVDVISVREKAAISYIKQFCRGEVFEVSDPVFLLKKEDWYQIENVSDFESYIFVYMTEYNNELIEYVKKLAREKNLMIIMTKGGTDLDEEDTFIDYTADPSKFLGYIRKAEYVVTNSFHGLAFSIIYQKKFIVFQHNSVGERLNNILDFYGLKNRIYQNDKNVEIECEINWEQIERCMEKKRRLSEMFLMRHLEKFFEGKI